MVELSRTNRIVETQLSELTAESARNLTSASQLKRNHQITINQLEDDHQNEIQKHRLGENSVYTGCLYTLCTSLIHVLMYPVRTF